MIRARDPLALCWQIGKVSIDLVAGIAPCSSLPRPIESGRSSSLPELSGQFFPMPPAGAVTYRIDDLGDLCKLTMTHDSFASETATFRDVLKGWDLVLANLKMFAATGTALPY